MTGHLPAPLDERFEGATPLGAGAFGEVFRAHDRRLRREVAIKLERAPDPDRAGSRFLQEARLLARLHHPNLAEVFDLGELPDGRRYMVLELLSGRNLNQAPPADPLAVMRQVARALDAAHGQGVLHRDLKPSNVMVEPSGRVVLIDFGLARDLAGPRRTATGVLLGTPLYLAPELLMGLGEPTPASDWYAWGATLYFLLEGQPPLPLRELQPVIDGYPPAPPRLRRTTPGSPLGRACLAALALDPEDRPASAEEVEALLAAPPTAGGAAGPGSAPLGVPSRRLPRLRPPGRGGPRGPMVRVLATALVAGGLAGAFLVRGRPAVHREAPAPRGPAPLPPQLASRLGALAAAHTGSDGAVPLALRGASYARHFREVLAELQDARVVLRWRQVYRALDEARQALETEPEGAARLEAVVARQVLPLILHLAVDLDMIRNVDLLRRLDLTPSAEDGVAVTPEIAEAVRDRLQELASVHRAALDLEVLRQPRGPAMRLLVTWVRAEADTSARPALVPSLLEELDGAPGTSLEASLLQVALSFLPTATSTWMVHCPLRLRVLDRAARWLEGPGRTAPTRDRFRVLPSLYHRWVITSSICDPERTLGSETTRARLLEQMRAESREQAMVAVALEWHAHYRLYTLIEPMATRLPWIMRPDEVALLEALRARLGD